MTLSALRACVVGAVLIALGGSLVRAPFEYRGYDDLVRLQNQQRAADAPEVSGIHYAPAWSAPSEQDIDRAIEPMFRARSISLSVSRLAFAWGLALAIGASALWAAPRLTTGAMNEVVTVRNKASARRRVGP